MNKKFLFTVFSILTIVFIISACSDTTSNSEASDNANADYPEKTIELIIPYSPGGQTDIAARIFAEHMQKHIDNEIVVVNETGSGGAAAVNTVMKSDPDGYKLLFHHDAIHTQHAMGQLKQTYEDFVPIDVSVQVNEALVVNSDAPWDDLEDFVEDAKSNPGEIVYGADIGGTTHFIGGMLEESAGIDLDMQDFGDESDRMSAMLGGHVDITSPSLINSVDYEESGDYKILAAVSEERDPSAPDIPTAKEQGFDVVFPITHMLYGPKELSQDTIEFWEDAIDELIDDEEYQEALDDVGMHHSDKVTSKESEEFAEEKFKEIQEIGEHIQ